MSHGPGRMQEWVTVSLAVHSEAVPIGELVEEYASEHRVPKRRHRSVRNSMARALRNLEAAGKVKRNDFHGLDLWIGTGEHSLRAVAIHEAGHAVIDRALLRPLAIVTIDRQLSRGGVAVSVAEGQRALGWLGWDSKGRLLKTPKEDPYGNRIKNRKFSDAEREAHILGAMAGPMAESEFETHEPWRKLASSSDMDNMRRNRAQLKDRAATWEEYERRCHDLINKHRAIIEAITNALIKRKTLTGHEVDSIAARVVRRQHLRTAK